MRVCLFEDGRVDDLEPLTLTRPAFGLLCGLTSLAAKQYAFFAATRRGASVRPHLADVARLADEGVAVNDPDGVGRGPVVLVNGRWLPPPEAWEGADAPCVGLVGGEVAYAVLDAPRGEECRFDTIDDGLSGWKAALPARPAGGQLVRHLWELVDANGAQITRDWEAAGAPCTPAPAGLAVVGPVERLCIDPSARVDPLVVADTTGGPVVVGREATVTAFTRLEGPCFVGPRSQVHGAKLRAGTSLGPECRVGGEVECSVLLGHSNKAHDGFLGHSYVGEWVNLGAGAQASDLRNDYGPVRVLVNGRLADTGRIKVGCFLGDHTKAGLGALLNTGTSAGAFGNLLPGGGLLPRHVPSFCRADGGALQEEDFAALLRTAAEVMRRRGQALTAAHRALYGVLFEQTAPARRRASREAERRWLRRGA